MKEGGKLRFPPSFKKHEALGVADAPPPPYGDRVTPVAKMGKEEKGVLKSGSTVPATILPSDEECKVEQVFAARGWPFRPE